MTFKKLTKRLGDRIFDLRHEAGLNQAQAAQRSGITRQHFQRLEAGSTNPRMETLYRVARVFGMSVGDLVSSVE